MQGVLVLLPVAHSVAVDVAATRRRCGGLCGVGELTCLLQHGQQHGTVMGRAAGPRSSSAGVSGMERLAADLVCQLLAARRGGGGQERGIPAWCLGASVRRLVGAVQRGCRLPCPLGPTM